MAAAFLYFPFFHIVDIVRGDDVCEAVRNDNDALFSAHGFYIVHDDRLALNVDIARRLVKDVYIFIRDEVDRKRQPLLLPARYVVCILCDDLIQPAVLLYKVCEIDFFKSTPDFLIGRVLLCKFKVGAHGVVKNISVIGNGREI